jgi:hypothetical protein
LLYKKQDIIGKGGFTSYNRTVTAPCGGFHKTPVGASAFVVFYSATFLRRATRSRCFSAAQKRQLQPKR